MRPIAVTPTAWAAFTALAAQETPHG
ncbi:hypothetical protein [Streptomyces fradiae]|nr:hypothetical protein [Streptomyces fradiae]